MPGLRAAISAISPGPLVAPLVALLGALPAAALDITLELDHARAIRLEQPASAVIVGNPVIADVTPHDGTLFLVTGKSFGETNVIALDDQGRQIYEANVRVISAADGRLVVHRGLGRESYACFGYCERVPVPGDATASFDSTLDARMKAIDAANAESQPK